LASSTTSVFCAMAGATADIQQATVANTAPTTRRRAS
jgi:hypothetical protein